MDRLEYTKQFTVDNKGSVLLIIDPQNDFHEGHEEDQENGIEAMPPGSLAVKGSFHNAKEISKMIETNLNDIDHIFVTLDSHHKKHIAHQAFWKNIPVPGDGDNEMDVIKELKIYSRLEYESDDDEHLYLFDPDTNKNTTQKWQPKDPACKNWAVQYSRKLKENRKKGKGSHHNFRLTIWPDHCLIGTLGHAIQPHIQRALHHWSEAPKNIAKSIQYICKGMNNFTEMYSAIEAEVPIESDSSTTVNKSFLKALGKASKLLICGQAQSHCVNYTVRDIMRYLYTDAIEKLDLKKTEQINLKKNNIFILKDGMSSIDDKRKEGEDFLRDMKEMGVQIIQCKEVSSELSWKSSSPAKDKKLTS